MDRPLNNAPNGVPRQGAKSGRPGSCAFARAEAESSPGACSRWSGPQRRALRFPRSAHLRKHAEFDRVYQQGRRLFSVNMTLFFLLREEGKECGGGRVGLTVGRVLGGAVQRNRLKRRLREAVRLHWHSLNAPVDVVINPKRTAVGAEFAQLAGEVEQAFAQICHRLKSRPPATGEGQRGKQKLQ